MSQRTVKMKILNTHTHKQQAYIKYYRSITDHKWCENQRSKKHGIAVQMDLLESTDIELDLKLS